MLADPELFDRPLGDGTLFDVLGRWYRADPPEALLWEAATMHEGASPAMIQGAARWLGVTADLRELGLDEPTIARVMISASVGEPPGWSPPGPVLARVLEAAGEAFDPGAAAAELLEGNEVPRPRRVLFTICTALLARRGHPIPASHDASFVFHVPWSILREVIAALPEDRRDAVLVRLIGRPSNDNAARVQMRYVLPVLDLATGEGARAAVAAAREHLDGKDRWAELVAQLDAGGGPPEPREGPTEECRRAVEYWLGKYEAKRRVERIGEVAQALHERAVHVDGPELASFETWAACSEPRRRAIGQQVADQVPGLAFRGLERFEAGELASFEWEQLSFRLVPGGSFTRGFSDAEEALVREEAERRRPAGDNWVEEFGHFLDQQLSSMRPTARVSVGPLLVCDSPGYAMAPDEVVSFLEDSVWRLPSESEWEYVARGGREHELTHRGHVVPDEAWFEQTNEHGEDHRNPFGLWGFGLQPELCADAWIPSYEGAPGDARPRAGEGTRVARGGAALIYPWQQVGEWQLLCSAVRGPAMHWEFEVAIRPVLGVEFADPSRT